MKLIGVLMQLYKMKLLSIKNIFHFMGARFYSGLNLMTLLRFAARMCPDNIAIQEENSSITYKELYNSSLVFLKNFDVLYSDSQEKKIALVGRNHIEWVTALFATSPLGATVYLISPDISELQMSEICNRFNFDYLLHDNEFTYMSKITNPGCKMYDIQQQKLTDIKIDSLYPYPKKRSHITLLTSGTTGKFKTASHRPATIKFFLFFAELFSQLRLDRFQSVYIATPLSHSFGVMSLILSVTFGAIHTC
ncbi:MAG: AMP-binding protein [Chitinophagaceae bacterium]|nr:AMP-binding protein [Chitinophagaceae bacterium]